MFHKIPLTHKNKASLGFNQATYWKRIPNKLPLLIQVCFSSYLSTTVILIAIMVYLYQRQLGPKAITRLYHREKQNINTHINKAHKVGHIRMGRVRK